MQVKLTSSQERILKLFQELSRSVTAQEIYLELRHRGQNTGLATVYRALEVLKRHGSIKSLNLPNGEAVYSLMPADKHHLNCVNCGVSLPIDSCPVRELSSQLDRAYDFKVYYHTLEFFGLCRRCQQGTETAPPE